MQPLLLFVHSSQAILQRSNKMSAFLDGIGSLIGKVTQWIPVRIEALKN